MRPPLRFQQIGQQRRVERGIHARERRFHRQAVQIDFGRGLHPLPGASAIDLGTAPCHTARPGAALHTLRREALQVPGPQLHRAAAKVHQHAPAVAHFAHHALAKRGLDAVSGLHVPIMPSG